MSWERVELKDGDYIEHKDGVKWFDARPPHRRHRCEAQTRAWFGVEYTERCACGMFGPAPWILLSPDKPRVRKFFSRQTA